MPFLEFSFLFSASLLTRVNDSGAHRTGSVFFLAGTLLNGAILSRTSTSQPARDNLPPTLLCLLCEATGENSALSLAQAVQRIPVQTRRGTLDGHSWDMPGDLVTDSLIVLDILIILMCNPLCERTTFAA